LNPNFDHLVFDLDDTLLDTHRVLIPRASREACLAMLDAGLDSTIEECLSAWDEHAREHSRREVFAYLVQKFGVQQFTTTKGNDATAIEKRGYHAFYHRKVETDITLIPGVNEMLAHLGSRYTLHLVTSGSKVTQEEKIRILDIRSLFESISHVDPSKGQKKRDAFSEVNKRTKGQPERHLSIGNRIDTDIGEAREIGWKGCWVRYGEYVTMLPSSEIEKPDYEIDNILELTKTCQL
jgi:putative hydrolase of the HAD superfamily